MPRPEPQLVSFEIDGREITAPAGTMLVDACKLGDVEIPYFCYEPKLGQPVGACRMCLVEIEGIPKLQTSCSTPVKDGMVVVTTSDRVRQAQNAVVEFLLVNHPLDCPVCDKGGECPLQDISYGWGPGRSRFIEPKRHFKKPLELSPLIGIDRERCILCYRCVRFSQEVAEDYQLVFLGRGDHTFVGTHDGRPYVAPFSGNITELCPVGALTSTSYRFRARPWDIEDSASVCMLCPSQCNLKYTVRDDARVMRAMARDNPEVDDGWLCDKGRYGFQAAHSRERITAPLARDGGSLREVPWERALAEAAAALGKAGGRTAAVVGGRSTNEEGFLVQHLIRQALGSPHVDSRAGAPLDGAQARALARPELSAKLSDLDYAAAILLVESEPVDEAPILDLRLRKAVRRNGAKLVVLSSRPSTLDPNAAAALRHAPGRAEAALAALAAALGSPRAAGRELAALARAAGLHAAPGAAVGRVDGAAAAPEDGAERSLRAAAGLLRDAEDVVVLWGERVSHGARGREAVEALLAVVEALELGAREGSGAIEVPAATNGRGLREAGCLPNLGPGLAAPPAQGLPAAAMADALAAGELGALLLVHADPLRELPTRAAWEAALEHASAVVAVADFRSPELERHADVVFPAESHAEKEGTLTHPDGRLQRVRQSIGHPGEVRPAWWTLAQLCDLLDAPLDAAAAPSVTEALTHAVPFYAGITLEELGGHGVRWPEREAAQALPRVEASSEPLSEPPSAPDGLELAAVASLWTGHEVEHSPALRFLAPRQRVELCPADAARFGIAAGDEVVVSSNGSSVRAIATPRTGVPPGGVFLLAGTSEESATALAPGAVELRLRAPAEASA